MIVLWAALAWGQDHAATFPGTFDHVLLGAIDPGPAYTVEAWVQLDAVLEETVICTSDADYIASLCVQYRLDQWAVKLNDDDPLEIDTCTEPSPHVCFPDDLGELPALVHVAVTVDLDEMVLWLDGEAVATGATGEATRFDGYEWALGIDAEPERPLEPAGWNNDRLDGLVDEVRVWDHVRTAAELACTRDWALTGREAGLVGLWSLDTDDGGVTPDATGNGHDGLLVGTAALVPSPFGLTPSSGGDVPCLDFDGDGVTPAGGDCDDTDPTRHPGVPEVRDDGVDQDCDDADTTTRLRGGLAGCDCDAGAAGAGPLGLLLLASIRRVRAPRRPRPPGGR